MYAIAKKIKSRLNEIDLADKDIKKDLFYLNPPPKITIQDFLKNISIKKMAFTDSQFLLLMKLEM